MQTEPILLVEDNPDDAHFTRIAFTAANFPNELVLADDGAKALELLFPADGSLPLRPAIILLDINLPRVGGLDVLRRVRSEPDTELIPVIMLSTSNLERDILESYRNGANGYVCKPVRIEEFRTVIASLATFWLGTNHPPYSVSDRVA